jgi:parallel beta-helix repeat protein
LSPSRLAAAAGSHPGREREHNEDRVLCDPQRGIFAVVDGVGGESGGEIAAQTAVDVLRARLSRRTTDLGRLVREAIALANKQILEKAQADPRLTGMSCVLTVAMLDGDRATIGHVGDSRLYQLRRGEIRKVTRDHSPVGAREDAGEISESEAMHHPRRNEIFRDVGSAPHEPDDEGFVEISEIPFDGDSALLICSDGLSDLVTSAAILESVERHAGDPDAAVQELIDRANEAGGKDNVSVVLVEGERFADSIRGGKAPAATAPTSVYRAAHAPAEKGARWGVWLGVVAALVALAALVYFFGPQLRGLLGGIGGTSGTSGTETPQPPGANSGAPLRVSTRETDFGTIADALAEARPGQTVVVDPGEYRESIRLPEGVSLVSATPGKAILRPSPEATAGTPVITVQGVHGAHLSGFRIEGNAQAPLAVGIRLSGSEVEVDNVQIAGATAAGIESTAGDRSTVRESYVHDNAGAGIVVSGGSAPKLNENLISKNGRAAGAPVRPGVEILDESRPSLIRNRILDNGGPPVLLPAGSRDRVDEISQWNDFGSVPKTRAVRVAAEPRPAVTPATATPTPTPAAPPPPPADIAAAVSNATPAPAAAMTRPC